MHSKFFTAKNFIIFGISLVLLVLGYILLGQGPVNNPLSKSVAPIVLVAVYCVLIPFGILARSKEPPKKDAQQNKKGV